LSPGSLETPCCGARNQFGLCVFFLRDKDLSASVVNLRYSHLISYTHEQSPCLLQVLVCFLKAAKVTQHVGDIVFDVSAINQILCDFEMFVCGVIVLDRTSKIISAPF